MQTDHSRDPVKFITYHTGEFKARVNDNNPDDARLLNLVNFGMPKGALRVRATSDCAQFGDQYKDFTVELFGIQDDEHDEDEGEGSTAGEVEYVYDDCSYGRMYVWLRRVRMKGTPAAFEEMWYQPEKRWVASWNYVEYVPVEQREHIMARFAIGVNLGLKVQEVMSSSKRGGDKRPQEIQRLWGNDETLKGFARLVEELLPSWKWIKANVDSSASMSSDRQQEWASAMWTRYEIKPFAAKHPGFTKEILGRAVDNTINKTHREPVPLACYHAALEFEVKINGETLTIMDAYLKYEDDKPSPSTLVSRYRIGCALLNQSE